MQRPQISTPHTVDPITPSIRRLETMTTSQCCDIHLRVCVLSRANVSRSLPNLTKRNPDHARHTKVYSSKSSTTDHDNEQRNVPRDRRMAVPSTVTCLFCCTLNNDNHVGILVGNKYTCVSRYQLLKYLAVNRLSLMAQTKRWQLHFFDLEGAMHK